jgi:hypothetical protein
MPATPIPHEIIILECLCLWIVRSFGKEKEIRRREGIQGIIHG